MPPAPDAGAKARPDASKRHRRRDSAGAHRRRRAGRGEPDRPEGRRRPRGSAVLKSADGRRSGVVRLHGRAARRAHQQNEEQARRAPSGGPGQERRNGARGWERDRSCAPPRKSRTSLYALFTPVDDPLTVRRPPTWVIPAQIRCRLPAGRGACAWRPARRARRPRRPWTCPMADPRAPPGRRSGRA